MNANDPPSVRVSNGVIMVAHPRWADAYGTIGCDFGLSVQAARDLANRLFLAAADVAGAEASDETAPDREYSVVASGGHDASA